MAPTRFIALISGGKDGVFAITKLLDDGHDLVAVLYVKSRFEYSDSYMFQTVGSEFIPLIGICLQVPLYVKETNCSSLQTTLEYTESLGDEVEDLVHAVSQIQKKHSFTGISTGAILSSYQRNRMTNLCSRLGLTSLTPLWGKNQKELLKEMIDDGLNAVVVKIACPIFQSNCLGMNITRLYQYMNQIGRQHDLNYCGEGGEYETICLDCKYFKSKIEIGHMHACIHPDDLARSEDRRTMYLKCTDLSVRLKSSTPSDNREKSHGSYLN